MTAVAPHLAPRDAWHFGVLGIVDYRKSSKLDGYFDFLRDRHNAIAGDVLEVGVYRGASLLAAALLLRELGSDKRVIGFDSFSGFPRYHDNDALERFDDLLATGAITDQHHTDAMLNREIKSRLLGESATPATISGSGSFSAAPRDELERKIDLLALDNVELVEGDFAETMRTSDTHRYAAVLLDCDLYESHVHALDYAWPRVTPGGYVFLDEYYSLKFPGARIAINEFCDREGVRPVMHEHHPGEFERWSLRKPVS